MRNLKLFALATIVAMSAMLVLLYVRRPGPRPVTALASAGESGVVYVSSQIGSLDVDYVARLCRVRTIVDMRPDGEASDEPSHEQIEQIAKGLGLNFSYLPVPHESIPPATVKSLGDILLATKEPVVLYCRTGRRAMRTFALVEASRTGGPTADAILTMVKDAKFAADDLRPEIDSRIAARTTAPEAKQ